MVLFLHLWTFSQCFGSVFIWSGSNLETDPIRIWGFDDQKWNNIYCWNFFFGGGSKTTIYLSLGLHKGFPSYRRSLRFLKTWNFLISSTFVGNFCPLGSGYRSTDLIESGSETLHLVASASKTENSFPSRWWNYIFWWWPYAGLAHDDWGGQAVGRRVLHRWAGQEWISHHGDHHQDGRLPVHLRQLHQVNIFVLAIM